MNFFFVHLFQAFVAFASAFLDFVGIILYQIKMPIIQKIINQFKN
jgi:hypothetical protein